jgi:hypothetical protein
MAIQQTDDKKLKKIQQTRLESEPLLLGPYLTISFGQKW